MTIQPELAVYPTGMAGAPNDRAPLPASDVGLPAGTRVFSADGHISVADDIFYENCPASMRDRVPRLLYENGTFNIGLGRQSFLPPAFAEVVKPYHGLAGCSTGDMVARKADHEAEGITRELAFQQEVLVLLGYPDHEVKDICFRIYNEYMAELQERWPGYFYGVGFINWWDPKGARETLAQMKSLGIKTFLMPLKPGNFPNGEPIEYASEAMTPIWEEIEDAGIPVSHHIGEGGGAVGSQHNSMAAGFFANSNTFREMFARYTFGGLLDRHPKLKIGWFEGGISWVPPAIQDAQHCLVSYRHMNDLELQHDMRWYWQNHMYSSFMVDPVGLELIDWIGVDRVMWSTDYPHNESTWGYSQNSLKQVVDIVGPENARKMVAENVERFLNI
jgi:predicted TIM-barrel fold metal-dependent hydrolase